MSESLIKEVFCGGPRDMILVLVRKPQKEAAYHGIVAIAGQDDHINGRCMISHTDATISWSVFPGYKIYTKQ